MREFNNAFIAIRSAPDAAALSAPLRGEARPLDPARPVRHVQLCGHWRLADMAAQRLEIRRALASLEANAQPAPGTPQTPSDIFWDGGALASLDSAGAMLLWRNWGRRLPANLLLRPEHQQIFARLAAADARNAAAPPPRVTADSPLHALGALTLRGLDHLGDLLRLIGQLALDLAHVLRHPGDLPRREISANIFKSGVRAMPVTALVGFLIGVVLAYLSALQLRRFGANLFIVNILGLGLIRELGPVLVAVLVAGRSGSAMTAQLGVMRVTEEIDALATMGVSRSLRLVLPKVLALAIAVPLLVLWTTSSALMGGMLAAQWQLDISPAYFIQTLPRAVPVANLWIGLSKGVVFGVCVALVACHFGLRVRPNSESLSANTTASVVTAITVVIIVNAIFAVVARRIGLPS